MGRNRFVVPEIVRLDIGEGDWIEVKKRLTTGELRKSQIQIKDVRQDGRMTLDLDALGKAEALAYLHDWSVTGPDGKVINIQTEALKAAALDNLDPDDFEIISKAIAAHVDRVQAERTAEKNATDGENKSSAISPSAA